MRVLLIDDHALFRDGILLVLNGLNIPIESFEAGSCEAAKKIIAEQNKKQNSLDLILLDLGLPGISGLDALTEVKNRSPKSSVVVLSGSEDFHMAEQALRYGAQGYIPKSSPTKIILHALQLVIAGGTYIPPQVLNNKVTTAYSEPINNERAEHKLTPRQHEVLLQLTKGKSNKEISKSLALSESTIRAHVAAILKTFNVSNRTQAAQYAKQRSWI